MPSLLSLSLLLTTVSSALTGPLRFITPDREATLRSASAPLAATYPAYNLAIPIDHFKNSSRYEPHSDGTFNNRYWFDASHYKPGGPVILFMAGEASGDYRFPLLEKGILYQLASAHNGIGVILEHRYYGTSFPFKTISTADARFLTTEQALADAAYFAQHVSFAGLETQNLTSSHAPWIVYGVSYSGGQSAFLRKLYPSVFWGAVSSSGVTQAIVDFWQYFEPVRKYGPADCIWTQQFVTDVVDKIFVGGTNATLKAQFKNFFNYASTAIDKNFVNNLYAGVNTWQGRNWDKAIGSGTFANWCKAITNPKLGYASSAARNASAADILRATGYAGNATLAVRLLNYAGYLERSARRDTSSSSSTPRRASSSGAAVPAAQFDSWGYQTCTEWGYWVTGSGFPSSLGRPLLSRLLDVPFSSSYCKSEFGLSATPNVTRINQYGGFGISYPRLAIVNGLADVWREATPAASAAEPRTSTAEEPWLVIDVPGEEVWDGLRGAGHHWEANGVGSAQAGTRPGGIREAQEEIVGWVGEWVGEWKKARGL